MLEDPGVGLQSPATSGVGEVPHSQLSSAGNGLPSSLNTNLPILSKLVRVNMTFPFLESGHFSDNPNLCLPT